ncbi:pyrroline-5-carboxylate reductase [Marinobacteraceae bacterium S3BR75-40.1]
MTEQPAISFIGAGNMASAILGGMLAGPFDAQGIWVSAPEDSHLQRVRNQFGVNTTTDNKHCASQADIIILAVKPQILRDVCQEIASVVQNTRPLVISIAAGLDTATISSWLGGDLPVIRCMPNTPALVGKGASALYATDEVDGSHRQAAEKIFASVGKAVWVKDEDQMHAVTALSGSGPAYCFLILEALEEAAVEAGIEPSEARQLAIQTMAGAAAMAQDSGEEPAQLKRNVMSPNGVTERAIQTFEDGGLRDLIGRAYKAAQARSREMSEQLTRDTE